MIGIPVLQKAVFRHACVDFGHDVFPYFLNDFFQNESQLAYGQQQNPLANDSSHSPKDELSNALLEQFKEIAFKHMLSNNSSNSIAKSNSSNLFQSLLAL